jgi:hypothetical protein
MWLQKREKYYGRNTNIATVFEKNEGNLFSNIYSLC